MRGMFADAAKDATSKSSRPQSSEATKPDLLTARTAGRAMMETDTLEEAERNHIRKILRETKGVIGGANGAAARLGMKRSTLY